MVIKPCPFCGSGDVDVCDDDGNGDIFVYCKECELMTGYGKQNMIIKKWNGMSDAVRMYDEQ
jgi:Lar family restriction alleviation protein